MNWIDSSGGPLVLMEKNLTTYWGGCFSSENSQFSSDYELACSIEDYIDVVSYRGQNIIILGDEPDSTTFYSVNSSHVILVRWRWAKSEQSVLDYLSNLQYDILTDNSKEFNIESNHLILFDSAVPGTEINEQLEVFLEIGNYQVSSIIYEPDNETSLLLHKIYKI